MDQAFANKYLQQVEDDFVEDSQLRVNDYFKDGDEVMCTLTSADVWIKLKVTFTGDTEERVPMVAKIDLKASRRWTNEKLKRVVQKLAFKIWNTYFPQVSEEPKAFAISDLEMKIKLKGKEQVARFQRKSTLYSVD